MEAPASPPDSARTAATLLRGIASALVLFTSLALPAQEPAPGDAWSTTAELAPTDLLLAAQRIDGTIVVAGARGHVLFSDDEARTWNQSRVPTRSTLTALHFVSPEEGWVAGHDSIILYTSDGGQSWQIQNYAPEDERPLLDIWFADRDKGMAVGAYGLMLTTSDGGQTWEEVIFEPEELVVASVEGDDTGFEGEDEEEWWDVEELAGDYHLNDILATDSAIFIAGEAGNLYRAADGVEWVTLPSEYDGSFFGLIEAGNGRLVAIGLRGNAFYSDDRGESWVEVDIPVVSTLNSGRRLADGTIVIAGLGGYLMVSDDNGESFTAHLQDDRKGIQVVLELNDGRLLSIGEAGAQVIETGAGNE